MVVNQHGGGGGVRVGKVGRTSQDSCKYYFSIVLKEIVKAKRGAEDFCAKITILPPVIGYKTQLRSLFFFVLIVVPNRLFVSWCRCRCLLLVPVPVPVAPQVPVPVPVPVIFKNWCRCRCRCRFFSKSGAGAGAGAGLNGDLVPVPVPVPDLWCRCRCRCPFF